MIISSIVNWNFGLWYALVSATICGIIVIIGALRGSLAHRVPRMIVGACVTGIGLTYFCDLFFPDTLPILDMRRGIGWVLWPALAWTSISGMAYAKKIAREQVSLRKTIEKSIDNVNVYNKSVGDINE